MFILNLLTQKQPNYMLIRRVELKSSSTERAGYQLMLLFTAAIDKLENRDGKTGEAKDKITKDILFASVHSLVARTINDKVVKKDKQGDPVPEGLSLLSIASKRGIDCRKEDNSAWY